MRRRQNDYMAALQTREGRHSTAAQTLEDESQFILGPHEVRQPHDRQPRQSLLRSSIC